MRLQPSICSCDGSLENNPQPVLFMSISVSGTWVLGSGFWGSAFWVLGSVPINVSELTIQLTLRPLNHFRVRCVRMAKEKATPPRKLMELLTRIQIGACARLLSCSFAALRFCRVCCILFRAQLHAEKRF